MKARKFTAGIISAAILCSYAGIQYSSVIVTAFAESQDEIVDPSKYKLNEQGNKNADCAGNGDGITNTDALAIQKLMLKIIDKLPV